MKRNVILLFIFLLMHSFVSARNTPPKLLLRLDDNGMNHSVTMAIKESHEQG
jgi:hypothetical protein